MTPAKTHLSKSNWLYGLWILPMECKRKQPLVEDKIHTGETYLVFSWS